MCRSTGFHCIRRFQLRGKCPSDHASRFHKPPVSSRTVGFPESGWRPWHFPTGPSRKPPKLKRRLVCTPGDSGLPNGSTHHGGDQLYRARSPELCRFSARQSREPLCLQRGVTLLQRHVKASRQRALPLFHSSYGLMRRTKSLPLTSFSYFRRSLQVVASPCWEMALPDVISAIHI